MHIPCPIRDSVAAILSNVPSESQPADVCPTGSDIRSSPALRAADLAGRQHEIVTTRELAEIGVGRRTAHDWARAGRLTPLHRGVYKHGSAPLRRQGRWLAAVKACGPGALLSHLSAAVLWALLSVDPRVIHVTVPRGRRGHDGIRLHASRKVGSVERTEVERIPVTSPERTWFDLAAILSDQRLKLVLSNGERAGILDPEAIRERLPNRPGVPGWRAARRVLDSYMPAPPGRGFRSGFERTFWEAWIESGGEEPEVNAYVCGYECDVVWRAAKLVVELDSREYHRTSLDLEHDRLREQALRRGGFELMRLSDAEVEASVEGAVASVAAELDVRRRHAPGG